MLLAMEEIAMLKQLAVAVSVVLFALCAIGQTSSNTPTTATYYPATPINPLPPEPPMMPVSLVVPLFLQGNQFSSTLTLVNNSTANTYADVTLRALDGSTIALLRVKFAPHSQQQVDIGELLNAKNSPATAGSILVMQSSALAGPAIAATLSMTYLGSADPNYIDEEIFMPSMMGSSVLQGVADRANGSPVIAISSLTGATQHVSVQCLGEHGASTTRQIELAAGETLITDACAGPDIHGSDFQSALGQMDDATHGPVGIRLTSDAMPGSFAAFALAPHRGNGDRYFSSVLFADPKTVNSANTVFTGVPVGAATLLPYGKYTPAISMTNFSVSEVHVHVTFAQTSGSTPQAQEVGSVTVPPGTSRELTLKGLEGDPDMQNSFILDSDGAPGALMAKFVSTSDTQLHEVELQAKDASDMDNAGNHPWSIAQSTESTLLLFNHSGTAQNFDVSIFSHGATWQKTYKLAPMQTKAVSIRELIENRVKDDSGNVLPKDAQSGEINWMDAVTGKGSGRMLESDKSAAMARNFSCGWSGLLCGLEFYQYLSDLGFGQTGEFGDMLPITCTSGEPQYCSGQQTGTGGSFTYSWTSGTPSVASVYGDSTLADVSLLGNSLGTSQVHGRVQSQYCFVGGGGPVAVSCPIPTAETNEVYAENSTITSFGVTLSDPARDSFAGRTVSESSPQSGGTNTCYWAGNPDQLTPNPKVNGGSWTVDGGGALNIYSPDYIGYYPGPVSDIRSLGVKAGVTLPCITTIPQIMSINSCTGSTSTSYITNSDTITVSSSSVKNCRAGTCDVINQ
jgi:hypothetical protein